jgi:secondary thiamine-phosphate synthase enzyme
VIIPSFLERLQIETGGSFHCHAITADLQALVERSGVWQGLLVAVGQHTTTALVLNENEELLLRDIEAFFLGLAPPERPWLHNDLHLRQGIPPDEPRNAHAHLIAMMLGNQLSLPVVDGRLGIGRWQSVLLVELDGPRRRPIPANGKRLQQTELISEQWAREDIGSKLDPSDGNPVMGPSGAPQKNPALPGCMNWLDQAANKGMPEAICEDLPSRICPY